MAYKTSDKDYYLYTAWVIKIIRYLLLVITVAVIIVNLTVYNEDINSENMRYILKNIDFDVSSISKNDTMQIDFTSPANTASASYLRGDVVLLSRQGYESYDFSGKKGIAANLSYSNPALKTSERYALCYDIGGRGLSIFNAFSNVYEGEFPLGISNACINDDGSFSVVTSESGYRSGVIVYSSDFKKTFTWMSPDVNVLSVDMPNSSKKFIAAGVSAHNGEFVTEVYSFDTSVAKSEWSISINDEFPLAVEYTDDGIVLLTDRTLSFYTDKGALVTKHEYEKGTLSKFFNLDEYVAVSIAKGISETEELMIYSSSGDLLYSESYVGGVSDIDSFSDSLFILEPGKLHFKSVSKRAGETVIESKKTPDVSVDGLISRVFASTNDEYILLSAEGAGKFS